MYKQWDMFGIPSRVMSDQGPQFAAAWWRTMCAALGVRVAYGHAYHHQANGRAEVAGQQVIRCLRKLIADEEEEGAAWVELLPKALRFIHDLPGEAGLSPYEIVFGRHRPLALLPYPIAKQAPDSVAFMKEMEERDKRMAHKLNEEHKMRADRINKRRLEPPPLKVGEKVWYRPERQPGTDKLAPEWRGPAIIKSREGKYSYTVELTPGSLQPAHRSQLQPHVEDSFAVETFPMHYYHGKPPELVLAPDEFIPEKFLDVRKRTDGTQEILTKWVGYTTPPTWEPMSAFFSPEMREFCEGNGLQIRLVQLKKRAKGYITPPGQHPGQGGTDPPWDS